MNKKSRKQIEKDNGNVTSVKSTESEYIKGLKGSKAFGELEEIDRRWVLRCNGIPATDHELRISTKEDDKKAVKNQITDFVKKVKGKEWTDEEKISNFGILVRNMLAKDDVNWRNDTNTKYLKKYTPPMPDFREIIDEIRESPSVPVPRESPRAQAVIESRHVHAIRESRALENEDERRLRGLDYGEILHDYFESKGIAPPDDLVEEQATGTDEQGTQELYNKYWNRMNNGEHCYLIMVFKDFTAVLPNISYEVPEKDSEMLLMNLRRKPTENQFVVHRDESKPKKSHRSHKSSKEGKSSKGDRSSKILSNLSKIAKQEMKKQILEQKNKKVQSPVNVSSDNNTAALKDDSHAVTNGCTKTQELEQFNLPKSPRLYYIRVKLYVKKNNRLYHDDFYVFARNTAIYRFYSYKDETALELNPIRVALVTKKDTLALNK